MIKLLARDWSIQCVDAVLFDKDGTFVDSNIYWGGIICHRSEALVEHYRLNAEAVPVLMRSMGLDATSGLLLPEGPVGLYPRDVVINHVIVCLSGFGVTAAFEEIARIFTVVHQRFLSVIDDYIQLLPGFVPLVTALRHEGVKIAVVTTDTLQNTNSTLRRFGVADVIDVIVGSESSKEPKETGVPAKIAMDRLRVSASNTVCIGDAPMDIFMARNAGCLSALAVATGQILEFDLRALTPHVVSSLSEITVKPSINSH